MWWRWIRREAGARATTPRPQVLEMETGLQCAEFAGHVGGLELAQFVTDLATEYNGAWLVVERNNHGSGVLALAETACKYGRIYRQGGQAGWLTTSVSRPAMLGQLECGAGGGAGAVPEPAAAGGVPELCAAWRMGAAGRRRGRTTTG